MKTFDKVFLWLMILLTAGLGVGIDSVTPGGWWAVCLTRLMCIAVSLFCMFVLTEQWYNCKAEKRLEEQETVFARHVDGVEEKLAHRIGFLERVFAAFLVITSRPQQTEETDLTKAILDGTPDMKFEILYDKKGVLSLRLKSPTTHTVTVYNKKENTEDDA
jgi:hypothetical protein